MAKTRTPNAGALAWVSGLGTRSHVLQLKRTYIPQGRSKMLHAASKTWHSQKYIYIYFKRALRKTDLIIDKLSKTRAQKYIYLYMKTWDKIDVVYKLIGDQ